HSALVRLIQCRSKLIECFVPQMSRSDLTTRITRFTNTRMDARGMRSCGVARPLYGRAGTDIGLPLRANHSGQDRSRRRKIVPYRIGFLLYPATLPRVKSSSRPNEQHRRIEFF